MTHVCFLDRMRNVRMNLLKSSVQVSSYRAPFTVGMRNGPFVSVCVCYLSYKCGNLHVYGFWYWGSVAVNCHACVTWALFLSRVVHFTCVTWALFLSRVVHFTILVL